MTASFEEHTARLIAIAVAMNAGRALTDQMTVSDVKFTRISDVWTNVDVLGTSGRDADGQLFFNRIMGHGGIVARHAKLRFRGQQFFVSYETNAVSPVDFDVCVELDAINRELEIVQKRLSRVAGHAKSSTTESIAQDVDYVLGELRRNEIAQAIDAEKRVL